jgi:hypothetical protein
VSQRAKEICVPKGNNLSQNGEHPAGVALHQSPPEEVAGAVLIEPGPLNGGMFDAIKAPSRRWARTTASEAVARESRSRHLTGGTCGRDLRHPPRTRAIHFGGDLAKVARQLAHLELRGSGTGGDTIGDEVGLLARHDNGVSWLAVHLVLPRHDGQVGRGRLFSVAILAWLILPRRSLPLGPEAVEIPDTLLRHSGVHRSHRFLCFWDPT